MKETVLITGAFGYVGGRIAKALVDAGYELKLTSRRVRSASELGLSETTVCVQLDLLSDEDVASAVQDVEHVVHLSAVNEIESAEDPERALMVNGLGTLKILRAAEKKKLKKFIYFSTAHVYGAPLAGRLSESDPAWPIHPYSITHRTAEDFVLASHRGNRIQGLVVRLSNSFGPPVHVAVDRWTLLVNDLCRQVVADGRLVLKTRGLQLRDFITLEDVGRATAHLLALPNHLSGNGLFNLGGESSISVYEMACLIADRCRVILGFTPEIIRPDSEPSAPVAPLDFRMDKLKGTGFYLAGTTEAEIDATLRFCLETKNTWTSR